MVTGTVAKLLHQRRNNFETVPVTASAVAAHYFTLTVNVTVFTFDAL